MKTYIKPKSYIDYLKDWKERKIHENPWNKSHYEKELELAIHTFKYNFRKNDDGCILHEKTMAKNYNATHYYDTFTK